MSTDNKPREFWVKEAFTGEESGFKYPAHVTADPTYASYESGMVHVIEFSAYEAVCKERDELRNKLNIQEEIENTNYNTLHRRTLGYLDERDKLRAELEQEKKKLEGFDHEFHRKLVGMNRDLRSQADRLAAALEYEREVADYGISNKSEEALAEYEKWKSK